MKRSEFIKTLGFSSGGLILPKSLLDKNKVKIYDNYISGLRHYSFSKIEKHIKEGDLLKLKREPTNPYDAFAVEVYYDNYKIGYIAAYENIVIANMLDAQADLSAVVSHYKKDDDPYKLESLGVALFAELVVPTPQLVKELNEKRANDLEDLYRQNFNFQK